MNTRIITEIGPLFQLIIHLSSTIWAANGFFFSFSVNRNLDKNQFLSFSRVLVSTPPPPNKICSLQLRL
jgi:hypothetical protein